MSSGVRCLVGAVTLITAATACSPEMRLLLDVDTANVPGAQQLHITGRDGETLVFGPTIRPETAGAPLEGRQTLRVVLSDDAAGKTITVRVEALVDGTSRGAAQAEVEPRKHEETRVELTLEKLAVACEGCDGCCADGRCISASIAACGSGGVACFGCDPQRSDNCASSGRCACGQGPACSPTAGTDRCIDGECQCGNGPPCPAGTECENGICRCTPAACAGCCNANSCQPGTVDNACGENGSACAQCSGGAHCLNGTCQ